MIKPRLAIDLRYAAPPLSGFGRFTWNLLEGLVRLGPREPVLLLAKTDQTEPACLADQSKFVWWRTNASPYSPMSQWRLARRLAKEGVTTLVSPDVFAPFGGAMKQIITLHDIIPIRCPELLSRSAKGRYVALWRQWLRLQIRNASLVLTVSDHAKSDIASAFRGSEDKLRTVYNAVCCDAMAMPRDACPREKTVHLLYVGRTALYKNILGCVETLAALREGGLDAVLTIVGERDPRYGEVDEAVQRLGLQEAVNVTGHVDDDQLRQLYRDASVFLFLSRYEGFGLPPLEAMAHGLPVVASNQASMPEVLGDAALLADPDDIAAAVSNVRRIVEEPDLAEDLQKRGLARAAEFTLERQATMFWDAVSPIL